jgi:uncharacterized SAM-dependent methyltransferase
MAPSSLNPEARIIDIRRGKVEKTILDDMREQLRPQEGMEKRLPTLLLYDEAGLQFFEDITYLDEYYLTNAEIDVLKKYGDQIARRIRPGSLVVELGSGYDMPSRLHHTTMPDKIYRSVPRSFLVPR